MAWGEQLYRGGPAALGPSPLLRIRPGDGPAEVLDLVPDHLIEQLVRLAAVSEDRLIRAFPSDCHILSGCRLSRRPIAADADLVLDDVLLELKCTTGNRRATGRTFTLGPDLVRQLIGYLLLDENDRLQAHRVGVYAARFGLLWTMEADELLTTCYGRRASTATARTAFARLWRAAA